MQLIATQRDVAWMPKPNEVRFVVGEEMPPSRLTTSAFVFAFEGQQLLMTKLTDRGWDLPGGHIEAGESAEAALRREVLEESACLLEDLRPLGYLHVLLHCAVSSDYPYPYPESYQLLYLARVDPSVGVESWRCPQCREDNPGAFELCWNCGEIRSAKGAL